jgi:molecular chaperone HtpG
MDVRDIAAVASVGSPGNHLDFRTRQQCPLPTRNSGRLERSLILMRWLHSARIGRKVTRPTAPVRMRSRELRRTHSNLMIDLPNSLTKLLEKDLALDGAVKLVVSRYDELLRWSTLPFFPEYTDHGPRHLSEVLQTLSDLITPESWNLLTPKDAAVSILSVLFHDLGMHIAEDGFFALTDPQNVGTLIPQIDSQKWPDLWEDFVAEARRFDQKRLMQMFGDTLPVNIPSRKRDDLTGRDRKLMGEFIRRHHPRLAHEFALFGFQGSSKRINVVSEAPQYLLDISGLIARSHGFDLRKFLPYIEKHYSLREYNGIHSPFLMALLRISDYLQIHAERASKVRQEVQNIASPFSLREWRTHGAVIDVSKYHDDPESIYVRTIAPDPEVYLNLKDLLSNLQYELDSSWAVLGEVYGRFPPLNKLGLTLRRIRSDLDETNDNSNPGDFVRSRFSFESAGAELLKLLATPLYGGNPNSGVRELLQNSLDAVREMEAIAQRSGIAAPTLEQESDVVISLDGNNSDGYTLKISDKGVGMNSHILKNYFLRAGASYRRSTEWQRGFADGSGHSTILRSGRFGIGVLAAFILGPQVAVRTRHYTEQYGLSFSARLETDPIDLRYCEMPVGTEIQVAVAGSKVPHLKNMFDSKAGDALGFGSLPAGLYVLPHPSLALQVNGHAIERTKLWPDCGQTPLPPGWNRIKPKGFEEVQWQYRPDALRWTDKGQIACNGIAVFPNRGVGGLEFHRKLKDGGSAILTPTLSVFDPDGNLALTLDRTALETSRLPFENELIRDIYRDVAAYLLAEFVSDGTTEPRISLPLRLDHSAFESNGRESSAPEHSYLFLENGFTVLDSKLASSLGLHTINVFRFPPRRFTLPRPGSGEGSTVEQPYPSSSRKRNRAAREAVDAVRERKTLHGHQVIGARVLCSEEMCKNWKSRIAKQYLKELSEEAVAEGCQSLTIGRCLPPSLPLSTVADAIKLRARDAQMVVVQFYVVASVADPQDSMISRAFLEDIGSTSIPYKLSERKKLAGYDKLSRQIEFHEARLKAKATRKS